MNNKILNFYLQSYYFLLKDTYFEVFFFAWFHVFYYHIFMFRI